MNFYQSFGYDEFIIAAGYKQNVISEYYKNSKEFKNSDGKKIASTIKLLNKEFVNSSEAETYF